MTRVIVAVHGLSDESGLIAQSRALGLDIVRRCVDAADLLACAAAEPDAAIVLTLSLPRLTAGAVEHLGATGRTLVVIAGGGDATARIPGRDVPGRVIVVPEGVDGQATATAVAEAVQGSRRSLRAVGAGVIREPDVRESGVLDPGTGRGLVIAVWGPGGAPGRTSVAIGLAEALSAHRGGICTVDADTHFPSMAFGIGLAEPSPGLLGACRRAENSGLAGGAIVECCRAVGEWTILAGLDDPARWRELRAPVLDEVWAACRRAFAVTVIDVGSMIEGPDEGPWSVDRNAAARTALAQADVLVAVADAGALGAARLAASWEQVRQLAPGAHAWVVRNRVRAGLPVKWEQAVRDLGVHAPVLEARMASSGLERCWARGRTPRETRGARGWARAMDRLAASAVPH